VQHKTSDRPPPAPCPRLTVAMRATSLAPLGPISSAAVTPCSDSATTKPTSSSRGRQWARHAAARPSGTSSSSLPCRGAALGAPFPPKRSVPSSHCSRPGRAAAASAAAAAAAGAGACWEAHRAHENALLLPPLLYASLL
jgi:hypothetical protein